MTLLITTEQPARGKDDEFRMGSLLNRIDLDRGY